MVTKYARRHGLVQIHMHVAARMDKVLLPGVVGDELIAGVVQEVMGALDVLRTNQDIEVTKLPERQRPVDCGSEQGAFEGDGRDVMRLKQLEECEQVTGQQQVVLDSAVKQESAVAPGRSAAPLPGAWRSGGGRRVA